MPNSRETLEKIRSFANLPEGWHYGEGVAVPEQNINAAIEAVAQGGLLGFAVMNAFPGISGEIQVTFYDGDDYYEITIDSIEDVTIVHEIGRREVCYQEGLILESALIRFEDFVLGEDIASDLCYLSESSTPFTMIQSTEDLHASPSEIRLTKQIPMESRPYQSLTLNAPREFPTRFVPTSLSTIAA